MPFDAARAVIVDAIARAAFPGAVVEVGSSSRVDWTESFGRHTYDSSSPATEIASVFDLA